MPRITALTALTTPDIDADVLAIEDIDAGTTKKITPETIVQKGIDLAATSLTELTSPDRDADYLIIDDTDAAVSKKITPENVLGYKEYIAYITQTSTSAPVIVATLKDDFGATVTTARSGVGTYRIIFDSLNIGNAYVSWSQATRNSASEPTGGFFQLSALYSVPLTDTDVNIWSRNSGAALADGILSGWLTVRL